MDKKKIASTLLIGATGLVLGNEALHHLHPEETHTEKALYLGKKVPYLPHNHQEQQDTRPALETIAFTVASSGASLTVFPRW